MIFSMAMQKGNISISSSLCLSLSIFSSLFLFLSLSSSLRFDVELCVQLAYKGHEQVVTAATLALQANVTFRKVIDLGCGTGLCGALLKERGLATYLVGVDISEEMLKKAQLKKAYDLLVKSEITEYIKTIKQAQETVDLIIAADVFIYVGDLHEVMSLSSLVLRCQTGLLVFTIEDVSARDVGKCNKGFFLQACGRFGHSLEYILELAEKYGFDVISSSRCILRTQGDLPVTSLTVVMRRK